MSRNDVWAVRHNIAAGEVDEPQFYAEADIAPGQFGGHGHNSYALFSDEASAREWAEEQQDLCLIAELEHAFPHSEEPMDSYNEERYESALSRQQARKDKGQAQQEATRAGG